MFRALKENVYIFGEYTAFLFSQRKWWFIPIFLIIIFFGLLVAAAHISPLLPFVYTLF
ncbi:hypothetical protein KAI78_07285 [bacterium]|nr:hypothetical protein [bacterium]